MSSLDKVRVPGGVLLSRAVFGDRFIAVDQDRVCCFLSLKGGGLYIPTQRYGPLTLILTKIMIKSCMGILLVQSGNIL